MKFIKKKIENQLSAWSHPSYSIKDQKSFITISREYGSEGWDLAKKIEDKLNQTGQFNPSWVSYNEDIFKMLLEDTSLNNHLLKTLDKESENLIEDFFNEMMIEDASRFKTFKSLAKIIKTLALHGHTIIVGYGGNFITQKMTKGFHIRVVAAFDWRVQRIMAREKISKIECEKLLKKHDNERETFVKDYFFTDNSDPHYYEMLLNSGKINLDQAAEIIIDAMKRVELI